MDCPGRGGASQGKRRLVAAAGTEAFIRRGSTAARGVDGAMQHRYRKPSGCQVGSRDLCGIVERSCQLRLLPRMSRAESPSYTISELAREFALTTRAIRFYED